MGDRVRIIATVLRRVSLGFAFLSGIAMLLMMLAGTVDIIGTNVFAKPLPAAFEFMAAMMVVSVFFAVSLAQARRAHIRVEVVFQHLPRSVQFLVGIVVHLLNMTFYGLIAWFGWKAGLLSFEQGEFASGIVNFPIWPARFALCLGASLMTLVCLYGLVAHLLRWPPLMERRAPAPIS